MSKVVKAQEIQNGECFRKETGVFVYLRMSDSSVGWVGGDKNMVYGLSSNGNITKISKTRLVVPMPASAFFKDSNDQIQASSFESKLLGNTANVVANLVEISENLEKIVQNAPARSLAERESDVVDANYLIMAYTQLVKRDGVTSVAARQFLDDHKNCKELIRLQPTIAWLVVAFQPASRQLSDSVTPGTWYRRHAGVIAVGCLSIALLLKMFLRGD